MPDFRTLAGKAVRQVGLLVDYYRYRKNYLTHRSRRSEGSSGKVLFVAGRGMNVGWGQIWTYLGLAFAAADIAPCVLVQRRQWILRRYFRLSGAKVYGLEDLLSGDDLPFDAAELRALSSAEQWKELHYKNMPVGQMALSTYCRYNATGFIDASEERLKTFAADWIQSICRAYDAALSLYRREGITSAVFTETFIEEYGGFYYAALEQGLDIIKTSGTVRDNAIVVQRRRIENERLHHGALTESAWQAVLELPDFDGIKAAVDQNFRDRYGDKWYRSARNHRNTRIVSREEGREALGLSDDRKAVVIFSHILYDALFHFGDELFQDYATWLVETVRIATQNPNVDWFIKLHPSNLWRGEFHSMLGGQYEEEKLLEAEIGELPPHVRLIYADTTISPLGWYQIADYGISVRGTAGLEMACLGKAVITAGSGRYEGKGFTVDPGSIAEYRELLLRLPEMPPLRDAQIELAIRYAHGLFNLKPFVLEGMEPRLAFGKRRVQASDDISYLPRPRLNGALPPDLARFVDFLADQRQMDLLSGTRA